MTDYERHILHHLHSKVAAMQEVVAQWLEQGILSSGEARERLLELLDEPKLMRIQAAARASLAEHVEETFG